MTTFAQLKGLPERPPIERAARALAGCYIFDRTGFESGHPENAAWVDEHWADYLDDARTVLAALREPSEAMISCRITRAHGYAGDVDMVWREMIDAALAEGPTA